MSWFGRGRRRQPRPSEPLVLTLDPAFFGGTTELALREWARRTGSVQRINYGAIPLPSIVAGGVNMLDAALRNATVKVYVIGWSEGAQVIAKWLRDHGPTSNVDPANVTFVLIGNPERKHGGACVVQSPPKKFFGLIAPKAHYGGCGIPDDTPYRVYDVARQYDGWADVPTVTHPCHLSLSTIDDAYHMDYFTVGLEGALSHTEGNVTYVLIPTKIRRECDRAAIEADFERPPYQPEPLAI